MRLIVFIFLLCSLESNAQSGSFHPQVGIAGTNAIHKDNEEIRDWAKECDVIRGLRQINLPDSGLASSGTSDYAIGKADAPLVVSLGDGGIATLSFNGNIYDGEGADFVVFENGFGMGELAFLELAFVEVSSDGVNFVRFPSESEQQTNVQIQSFEETDASVYQNLAGKYTASYGVPFDIGDLPDTILLDKQAITHVRIVDVVGSLDPSYATFSSDSVIINDPWPTNFPQSGFDLDAVGVINSTIPVGIDQVHRTAAFIPVNCFDLTGRAFECADRSIWPRIEMSKTGQSRLAFDEARD